MLSARQIRQFLSELNRQGTTIFLTTHYIEEAERLCHRIALLVEGQIVKIGSPEELMTACQQEHIIQITMGSPVTTFLGALSQELWSIGFRTIYICILVIASLISESNSIFPRLDIYHAFFDLLSNAPNSNTL